MSIKNRNNAIGNRIGDLPDCSAVPQPYTPPPHYGPPNSEVFVFQLRTIKHVVYLYLGCGNAVCGFICQPPMLIENEQKWEKWFHLVGLELCFRLSVWIAVSNVFVFKIMEVWQSISFCTSHITCMLGILRASALSVPHFLVLSDTDPSLTRSIIKFSSQYVQ